MYKILNGSIKEVERELNKIHKSDKRLQVLIMNSYTYDGEPHLIVLAYIGN